MKSRSEVAVISRLAILPNASSAARAPGTDAVPLLELAPHRGEQPLQQRLGQRRELLARPRRA